MGDAMSDMARDQRRYGLTLQAYHHLVDWLKTHDENAKTKLQANLVTIKHLGGLIARPDPFTQMSLEEYLDRLANREKRLWVDLLGVAFYLDRYEWSHRFEEPQRWPWVKHAYDRLKDVSPWPGKFLVVVEFRRGTVDLGMETTSLFTNLIRRGGPVSEDETERYFLAVEPGSDIPSSESMRLDER